MKLYIPVPRWLTAYGTRFMPFADAASPELPMARLLRLSLFQISVGMAMVMLVGTLNRVMIVELHVPATLVSLMVALPLVAPSLGKIRMKSPGAVHGYTQPLGDLHKKANIQRAHCRNRRKEKSNYEYAQRRWKSLGVQEERNPPSGTGWWAFEPRVGRVADGVAARVDRLKAIGNGQVPLCAATAWRLLNDQ